MIMTNVTNFNYILKYIARWLSIDYYGEIILQHAYTTVTISKLGIYEGNIFFKLPPEVYIFFIRATHWIQYGYCPLWHIGSQKNPVVRIFVHWHEYPRISGHLNLQKCFFLEMKCIHHISNTLCNIPMRI